MELISDTSLSSDKVFEILVKAREEGNMNSLNYFHKGQSLEVLFNENIETILHKSFNIDVVSVSHIFGEALEKVDSVCPFRNWNCK